METRDTGWVSLERKLAAALTRVAHGEPGRQLTVASSVALSEGNIARGRALLAMVFKYYAAGSNAELMYDVNHLQETHLRGDSIEAFQSSWTMVLRELKRDPDPEILQFLYFRQAQFFKPLAEDVAHYKRARYLDDKSDYTLDYLWKSSERYSLMRREDAMQDALSRGLEVSTDKAAPCPSPQGKGGTWGNKGKGRSSSAPPGGPRRNGPTGASTGKG